MALMSCLECGKQISDQASRCPKCGYEYGDGGMAERYSGSGGNSVVGSVVLLLFFGFPALWLLLAALVVLPAYVLWFLGHDVNWPLYERIAEWPAGIVAGLIIV